MASGKCPKCEVVVPYAMIEPIEARQPFGNSWHGVSYLCPSCRTVLSVGIDPLALKADTVNGVLRGLGKLK